MSILWATWLVSFAVGVGFGIWSRARRRSYDDYVTRKRRRAEGGGE